MPSKRPESLLQTKDTEFVVFIGMNTALGLVIIIIYQHHHHQQHHHYLSAPSSAAASSLSISTIIISIIIIIIIYFLNCTNFLFNRQALPLLFPQSFFLNMKQCFRTSSRKLWCRSGFDTDPPSLRR